MVLHEYKFEIENLFHQSRRLRPSKARTVSPAFSTSEETTMYLIIRSKSFLKWCSLSDIRTKEIRYWARG